MMEKVDAGCNRRRHPSRRSKAAHSLPFLRPLVAGLGFLTTVAVRINVRLTPDAASESHCPFSLAWTL